MESKCSAAKISPASSLFPDLVLLQPLVQAGMVVMEPGQILRPVDEAPDMSEYKAPVEEKRAIDIPGEIHAHVDHHL